MIHLCAKGYLPADTYLTAFPDGIPARCLFMPCRQQYHLRIMIQCFCFSSNSKQTYLSWCLPCNKPDPFTVSTAPLRTLVKGLMKDTRAVYSFFIWMLSPPSICGEATHRQLNPGYLENKMSGGHSFEDNKGSF